MKSELKSATSLAELCVALDKKLSPHTPNGLASGSLILQPTAEQILALKVCDPAMGSGAFLVAVCRYLADWLVTLSEHLPFTFVGHAAPAAGRRVGAGS